MRERDREERKEGQGKCRIYGVSSADLPLLFITDEITVNAVLSNAFTNAAESEAE